MQPYPAVPQAASGTALPRTAPLAPALRFFVLRRGCVDRESAGAVRGPFVRTSARAGERIAGPGVRCRERADRDRCEGRCRHCPKPCLGYVSRGTSGLVRAGGPGRLCELAG